MSTTTTTPPRDLFSSLDDETLDLIFELAGPDFVIPVLNRRIYGFRMLQIYENVVLSNIQQAVEFADALINNLSLRALVGSIELQKIEDCDKNTLELVLRRIFQNLESLISLKIWYTPYASEVFLKSTISHWAPNLIEVTLGLSIVDFDDPFAPIHYRELSHCRHLTNLTILSKKKGSKVKQSDTIPIDLHFPSLAHLTLSGPLSSSQGSTHLLASSEATNLLLQDTSTVSNLPRLLLSIKNPENVKDLEIRGPKRRRMQHGDPITEEPQDIKSELSRFVGLECLAVSGSACGVGESFYQTIRSLPLLHSVCFGQRAQVSVKGLWTLVSSNPTLKVLELNNVWCNFGDHVVDEEQHDWIEPRWTPEFNDDDLCDLWVYLRMHTSIAISGTSIIALHYQATWEKALADARDDAEGMPAGGVWGTLGHIMHNMRTGQEFKPFSA